MELVKLPEKKTEIFEDFTKLQNNLKDVHPVPATSENLRWKPKVILFKNGKAISQIHKFDQITGAKIKTTHYSYFDNEKIKAIDEFDISTGKKIRTTNFVVYKSITEFDIDSGKKKKTINFDLKNEDKIKSIQEYDLESEKICRITVYRKNGTDINTIKEFCPQSGKVTKWTGFKENSDSINFICEYEPNEGKPIKSTYFHTDNLNKKDYIKNSFVKTDYVKLVNSNGTENEKIAKLIDNLYKNKTPFSLIN